MINGPLYEIWCDCCSSIHGVDSYGPTRRRAWKTARSYGWRKRKGQHVCPECIDRCGKPGAAAPCLVAARL